MSILEDEQNQAKAAAKIGEKEKPPPRVLRHSMINLWL
jgi:hypothetical protein